MSTKLKLFMATAVAAVTFAGAAGAAELKKVGEIAVPGEKLTSFDISYIDQKTQRYFLADRSNKSLDIIDTKTDKFIGRVGGMVGMVMKSDGKVNNDASGPNGDLVIGNDAWVTDGAGKVHVIDLKAMKVTDTIETGGKMRADELDYDAKDGIVAVALDAEDPPALVLISTKPGHKILGKAEFPDATDGLEQPGYSPTDGVFYVPVPEIKKDPTKGGVAVVSTAGKLVKIIPVDNCNPHGFVVLPDDNILLGCSAHGKDGMPPVTMILNPKTGKIVASIPDIGGSDEVAYSKKNGKYFTGSSNQPGGHVLGVIDAKTNKLVQKIAITGGAPHSVAVNETTGRVYMPAGAQEAGGCGCIQIFGEK